MLYYYVLFLAFPTCSFCNIIDNCQTVLFCIYRTSWSGVGSWPCNRATEGSNPKGTGLYFMILLKNVEKSLIGTDITV